MNTRSDESNVDVRTGADCRRHDAGDVGIGADETQAALRDFQQKEGLKATGRADADTMAKLGVDRAL